MTLARATHRLQDDLWLAVEQLLFQHTNPWELDEALVAAGFTIGPCEAQDHVGLERVLARQPDRPYPILTRMVAEGRLGKGGGVGFYRYPGGGGAVIDPLIEDLIREEAWFAKVARSEIGDAQIVTAVFLSVRKTCQELALDGHSSATLRRLVETAVHGPGSLLVP